jgi:phage regulator Rha-like protein
MDTPVIQQNIYEIRGNKVMIDRDLAKLYGVPTKSLNLSVKRNADRFPPDFLFQLTMEELSVLRFQNETSKWGGDRYLPYAFTELGVAMLSSVLNSQQAIQMNIVVMRTFVFMRQNIPTYVELASEVKEIRETVNNHGEQLKLLYEAIENFLDDKIEQKNLDERERIGFKK